MKNMKDQKIRKATVAFLYAVLLATACYITVEAVKYWYAQQTISQHVAEAVQGAVKSITLPDTVKYYQNSTTITGALNLTINVNSATIYLNCTNSNAVNSVYTTFTITVTDGTTNYATLNCLQSTPASFTLTKGTYVLNYQITWNATQTGDFSVNLDVWAAP